MNKFLKKGFIQVFTGISLCFIGPVLVSQAFNNQGHPLFIVVLIIGVILLVLAIYFGYRGISNILNGTLGPKNKLN
jgi:purine-cytosine permease-like protein